MKEWLVHNYINKIIIFISYPTRYSICCSATLSFREYTNLKIKQLCPLPLRWLAFHTNFKSSFYSTALVISPCFLFIICSVSSFSCRYSCMHGICPYKRLFILFRSPQCRHEVVLFNHFSVIHFSLAGHL